jgi:hypothetical protein
MSGDDDLFAALLFGSLVAAAVYGICRWQGWL